MGESSRPDRIEPVQHAYANLLVRLVRIGLILMVALFVVYATGVLPAAIPIADVPAYWTLDAEAFSAATGVEPGWSWVRRLSDASVLSFAGLVYFPLAAIAAVLAVSVLYAREGVRFYAVIALLEAVVLVVAAVEIFAAG